MVNVNFVKTRDVKLPSRGHGTDSGIDFFIPNDINDLFNAENCIYTPKEYISEDEQKKLKTNNFNLESGEITIPAGYGILIPSGIKIAFTSNKERIGEDGKTQMLLPFPSGEDVIDVPTSFDLVFNNKSGVATKRNLLVGASVVDEAYRGEIHFHLINASKFDVKVEAGDKIVQGIVRPVALVMPEEITVETYDSLSNTSRGEGGFGSTGTK